MARPYHERLFAALVVGVAAQLPVRAAAAPAPLLGAIMAALAALPDRQARFTEEKHLASLAAPLHDSGTLVFRHPAHLEKVTTDPRPENLVVDDGLLTIQAGGAPLRTVDLAAHPGLHALTITIVAVLAGDLPSLRHFYTVDATGAPTAWHIVLHPIDPALARFVREVAIDGSAADLRDLVIRQTNGDTQTLTIENPS